MLRELLLSEIRQLQGKSQQEVADAIGIKQPSLFKLEKQNDMQISTLRKIDAYPCGRDGKYRVTPVYGRFRAAVLGPAFMPGQDRSPVCSPFMGLQVVAAVAVFATQAGTAQARTEAP